MMAHFRSCGPVSSQELLTLGHFRHPLDYSQWARTGSWQLQQLRLAHSNSGWHACIAEAAVFGREYPLAGEQAGHAQQPGHGFGTAPVFLASISTILGAVLFLRFGYAVGHVGLWGSFGIIALGHLVTIPTVLAVAEIATNRRVAGGGAYYIISRSFGTSIGGSIGIALYLSQAISVAFYLVAFAEAFEPLYAWSASTRGIGIDPRWVSLPATALLAALMLTKGARSGVRALWFVSAALFSSILLFMLGSGPESVRPDGVSLNSQIPDPDPFGMVFATCFPAFTGMIAGLGLSGDLKRPEKSIPLGTIGATLAGMVVYALVAVKLAASATPEALADKQFIMAEIAIWGPAIYIGLGAAAFSSALGSLLVAPRTLQALARDRVLPVSSLNRLLAAGSGDAQEPVAATLVSSVLAAVFVLAGSMDGIAQVLTMFFMVTYGALCSVSFLEYFAGNPSYRPTFHSRWYVSLLGALMCALIMLQMSPLYALLATLLMVLTYFGLRRTHLGERDLTAIFQGTLFQLTRHLQIMLQANRAEGPKGGWRPSIVAVTRFGDQRLGHFDLLRWICYRHGFGQFLHFIEGEYSFRGELEARTQVSQLIERGEISNAGILVDSLICPSFSGAVAHTLQLPGVSGLPNNCVLFEFDKQRPEEIGEVAQGAHLAAESIFNVLVLRSTQYRFGYRSSIHLWVTEETLDCAPLMVLLAYIIVGHPEWRRAQIQLFACSDSHKAEREKDRLSSLLEEGRLPIPSQNITPVPCANESALEVEVGRRSASADLTIAGLLGTDIERDRASEALMRLDKANDVLFVLSSERVLID